jgi:thiol-disulfide isomerase/thioredoxin
VLLLNFWATWCEPCREDIPLLVDAQARYALRHLQVIGVAIDEPKRVTTYRRAVGMEYPTFFARDEAIVLMARFGNPFGSLPFSVIVDRDGHLLERRLGRYHDGELDRLLQSRLRPL